MNFDSFARVHKARHDGLRKEAFQKWLDDPLVKVLISMLPPGDHPDVLRKVLEACHGNGWDSGAGFVGSEILKEILKPPRSRL